MRFGKRAKCITNKAKINKEYTIPELKLLLRRAERKVKQRDMWIKVLETFILQNGLQLPKSDLIINDEKLEKMIKEGKHSHRSLLHTSQ